MVDDIRRLRSFLEVYRQHSFKRAAATLAISQSTLTKHIRRLESDLGASLFDRTTRTVDATSAGRALIDHAERVVLAADEFAIEARLQALGDAGRIRIGAIALAAETIIQRALSQLSRSHPELEAEVIVGGRDVYRDLAAGLCDVAIGDEANFAASAHANRLRKRNIGSEPIVLLARRGHPGLTTINRGKLAEFAIAMPSRYYDENRLFANERDLPRPRYRLNSLAACLRLAETSDVVTIAPASAATQALDSGTALVRTSVNLELNVHLIMATHAERRPSPAVRAFEAAIA